MDKTNLKQLRDNFFDETEEYFLLLDQDLNCIDVNRMAMMGLNFKREDVIGKNIMEISPEVSKNSRVDLYKKVMATGQPEILEDVSLHPSLGKIHLRIKAFKAGDGIGIAMQDITDLRRTIEELDTLSYKSAHDIRGPITNILGLAKSGARKKENPDMSQQYFDMIFQQAVKMDTILKGIMDTMRIRKGEKTIHKINFDEVIGRVFLNYVNKKKAENLKLSKNVNIKTPFFGDKYVLGVIIENLVDNSVKYKQDHNKSYVNVNVREGEKGIFIQVKDNGIGIPSEMQENIFKMFFRASYRSSGVGLGLYTVSQCVKKLSGQIDLDSEEGIGTIVEVFIPNELVDD